MKIMHRDDSTLLNHKGILYKLALVVLLVVGGGNFVFAQKALPYEYGFENNDLAGEGWEIINGTTGTYSTKIWNSSTLSNSGSFYFRFYSNLSHDPQILISPELSTSSNKLKVSFSYHGAGIAVNHADTICLGFSSTTKDAFEWYDPFSYHTSSYALYEAEFPVGTKYIAIKYLTRGETNTYPYHISYFDDFVFEEDTPYKIPTGFMLKSFTEKSATFSWEAGNSETAWQFAYSTSSSFTPGTDGTTLDITTSDLSDGKYTLAGLTEGTTYYAAIRADYGGGNYSEWTDKVSFTPSDIVEGTINDGSSNLYNYPIYYGGVAPSSGELYQSQFIIPKGSLEFAKGRQINKLVFYASSASKSFGNAEFEVYLKETDNNSFSSNAFESWGTCVANSDNLAVNSDKEMVIEFDTPFNYSGNKNLMIGFKQTVKGSNSSSFTWTGISATNAGYYYYGTYGNRYSYLPKVTITTVSANTAPVQMGANGYTTFASSYPLDLTTANLPAGLKAYKASIVDGSWVRFTEIDKIVAANTGILLEGTASETYYIPVADSGNDISDSNLLLVNVDGDTFTGADGYTYYAIKKNSDPLIFATFNPSSVAIPSNKAYLKVSDVQAHSLSCMFDDENSTTGVETMFNEQSETNSKIYNLQGQRVTAPQKGLYIVNGKKFINK